jgi:two-component system sensor histidine kinase CpxA
MAERIDSLITSQRRLISDISHELRSPLARLYVALELARSRVGEEGSAELDRIEREAERLTELIGQLLTLTGLESGIESGNRTSLALHKLLEEIAADGEYEAHLKNKRVRISSNTECIIHANAGLLRSAIENVVRNAVRYTLEGTEVTISSEMEGATEPRFVVIRIRDHGSGVPEEKLAEIFKPFYRIADSRDRQSGGTGLGLAITERALRLHNGTVTASNASGGGLLVELRLPVNNPSH